MATVPVTGTGARNIEDVASARRVVDMSDKIVMLEDDKKSLMTFLTSLGTRKVFNPRFSWLKDQIIPKSGTASAAYVGGVDAPSDPITIGLGGDSTQQTLVRDDIVKVPASNDVFRVIDASDMLNVDVVVLACDGATTAGHALNDLWVRIGNAREENSVLRDASDALISVTTQEEEEYNYTQTFRTAFGLSRRDSDSKLYGGPDRAHQRMKKMLETCEQINNSMWHGVRTAPDAEGRTTMGGFIPHGVAAANQVALAGALSETDLDNFIRAMTRFGSKEKVLFCSRNVAMLISQLAKATGGAHQVNYSPGDTKFGVQVTEYYSGTGNSVKIVTDHALEGVRGELQNIGAAPTPADWDGFAVLVDPANVKKAVFGGTDLQLQVDVQLPDQDGLVDAYIADNGLEWGSPDHHGLLTNVLT